LGAQRGHERRGRGQRFLVVRLRLPAVAQMLLEQPADLVEQPRADLRRAIVGRFFAVALDDRVHGPGCAVGIPRVPPRRGSGGCRLAAGRVLALALALAHGSTSERIAG
jgi:hypothetical protein